MAERIEKISHRGVVVEQEPGVAWIEFTQTSACAGCHAASVCGTSDRNKKRIKAINALSDIQNGDCIEIEGAARLGVKAVLIAYLIPAAVVVLTLVVALACGVGEVGSAIASLLMLIPTFGAIYLLKERIEREFVFTVKRRII